MIRLGWKRISFLGTLVFLCWFGGRTPAQSAPAASGKVLFDEPFEETNWESRGWYDSPRMELSDQEHLAGSTRSCVWHWLKKGDISPAGGGARAHIAPTESVTLSFSIKHSPDWNWTGRNYHPHEMHFLTTEDQEFAGPAFSHLCFYIEVVGGRARLAIQDGANIDQARIGQDLTGITEKRSVAGGNGDSDGYKGGHYKNSDLYWNGKSWDSDSVLFSDNPGPNYKSDWHQVQARFKLNSIVDGKGVKDGVLQYWYDGKLVLDYHDVLFRTGAHPDMKINQFLMTPYFGPGVPHEQSIWVDNLKITE